jgi:hypothetical protein
MKRTILILISFLSVLVTTKAQLSFYFLPELYGRSIDGLGTFQVQNLGQQNMIGQISITVKENKSGALVVTVSTPVVTFSPGLSNFSKSIFSNSAFNFSSNPYGSLTNQTRNLPPGEYTFCFHFIPKDKILFDDYENCFDGEIQPLVPIMLLNPAQMDSICTKRPVLSWQPPMPFSSTMKSRLILTEKKGDNEGVEDLLMKTPLLLLDNISTTTINYPSVNPELKEGKTYYWQVIAYEKGLVISKSEIWEFTVQCKEAIKPGPNDSYRELKLMVNGNYYIANRFLKFSFRNDYNISKLKYSILDVAKGGEEMKHLPEVKLQQGFNKIDIDISDLGLKPGNHYILKVYPFNEPPVEVRFVYKEDDTIEMQ